jgi:RNase P subunit RPR2
MNKPVKAKEIATSTMVSARYSLFFKNNIICEKCRKILTPNQEAYWYRIVGNLKMWFCMDCGNKTSTEEFEHLAAKYKTD